MPRIMLIASITLGSGDVPLLIMKALKQLKCDVLLYTLEEDLPLIEALFYKNVHSFNRFLFNRRVYKKTLDYRPDIFLIYGSNWGIFPETLRKIKLKQGCKIVVIEGNLNYWQWFQSQSFPYYDHFFSSDSYPIPLLQKPNTGLRNVHFLGACCDPEEHSRVDLTLVDEKRFHADITFIGGGVPKRRELFEHLSCYQLKLWGWGWDRSPILKPYTIKETVFGLKKTKIYSAAKICPHLQGGLYQVNGLSVRIFEIACCGRLPFTEPQQDLTNFFEDGEEVIIFKNPEDLKQKIEYYLSHLDEMERMAERARQRVLAEHTYKHRMKKMLEIVLN